jgi:enterobactin synthetase component D
LNSLQAPRQPHFEREPSPLTLEQILGYVTVRVSPENYLALCEELKLELPLPPNLETAVPKRQALYLAGRWCARKALQEAGLFEPPMIGTGPVGEPLWPRGWLGSITHSQTHVSAAVFQPGNYSGLGLDNEIIMSEKTLAAVKSRISTEAEQKQKPTEMSERLYYSLLFSAKESLYKALYPTVQRFFDFQAAQWRDLGSGQCELQLTQTLHPELQQGLCLPGLYQQIGDQVFTAVFWCKRAD